MPASEIMKYILLFATGITGAVLICGSLVVFAAITLGTSIAQSSNGTLHESAYTRRLYGWLLITTGIGVGLWAVVATMSSDAIVALVYALFCVMLVRFGWYYLRNTDKPTATRETANQFYERNRQHQADDDPEWGKLKQPPSDS
ncbi:MAG: hypothetical protein V4611_03330 [Patescibacteria group bacterium]